MLAPEIITVVAEPRWLAAAGPLPIVAFAYLAYGISQIADAGILARGHTYVYPLVTGTSVLVNVALCFILIPSHGMMGAAWATLAAYLWHALLLGRISSSIAPIKPEWRRLGLIAGAGVIIWVGVMFLPELNLLPRIAAKIGVLALYPLLLWILGFMSADERAALARLRGLGRTPPPEEAEGEKDR